MVNNEILDRSMQAAKNLMKIEIKDRDKALQLQLNELRHDGTLLRLNRRCEEILETEKGEIILNTPWLQKLVEATQDAIFKIGPNCILNQEDQNMLFSDSTCAVLMDDSNIITASHIISEISLNVTNNGFNLSYAINLLLMPWAEDTRFEIKNYKLSKKDTKIFLDREEHRKKIIDIEVERRALIAKEENIDDVLLRVETDLLLKQIKSDAIGEQSIDTIKELMSKYLDNRTLPEGMKLIK